MERREIATAWDTVFDVGGSAEDSTLLRPFRPAASPTGVYLADGYAGQILHFDRTGKLLWHFGRKGQGPDEFQRIRDVKVDSAGNAWVLDVGNSRMTQLSPDGVVLARVATTATTSLPESLIPLPNGEIILAVHDAQAPFVRMTRDGSVAGRSAFPLAEFKTMNPMVSQFMTAADPRTGTWVAAFTLGDGFFAFNQTQSTGERGRFVEHVDFPEVEQHANGSSSTVELKDAPVSSALSVTLSPTRLYVLFGGSSGQKNRWVDSYSLADGTYAGSYLLSRQATSIAWSESGLYVIFDAPYPHLALWKPRGASLP